MDILKILFILTLLSFPFGEIIRIPIFSIEAKLLDLSVAILFIAWTAVSIMKKRISKMIFLPILAFSLVGGVSLLFNSRFLSLREFLISFSYLARWVGYASIFSIVASFDKKFKSKIENFIFFLGLIIVVLGYVQYFFYYSLKNLYYLGWDEHLYRMFSVFLDPNFAGAFFALYVLLLINEIFINYENKLKLIVLSLITAISVAAMLLTYSRSAFLMLITGIVVLLILKKNLTYLGIFIVVLIPLIFVLPKSFRTEGTNFLRTASSEARIGTANQAINIFQDNPVYGVGFNAYRYAKEIHGFSTVLDTKSHSDAGTDNSFLFVLATTGIVGFGVFIFMWYKIFALRKNSALIMSCAIALFVNSLFINSLFYVFFLFWIWVIIGIKENN